MSIYIAVSIISLLALIIIHELGHFLMAKRLGVKVEEFGIGIPPRIFQKKIGDTVYSLNLLPIGAFVRLYGEDKKIKDKCSFSEKSIFERFLIIVAGVMAFWLVAFILLTALSVIGIPALVADDVHAPDARIVVLETVTGLPAESAGIRAGDAIKTLSFEGEEMTINTVGSLRIFLGENKGNELMATIERDGAEKEMFFTSFEEEGIMGVSLGRVVIHRYPWYSAPYQGFLATGRTTYNIVHILGRTAAGAIMGKPTPPGVQVVGPVGIVKDVFAGAVESGLRSYLEILVLISISLAIFNLLPIPALDGGRLVFLLFEKIKGGPIGEKIEQRLILASFILLVGLFILVTFYDIRG